MMSRSFRIAAWAGVVLGASAGLWLVFRPAPVPCDISDIDRGPLVVTVDEDGRTRLKERYVVSAPLAGLAERMTLKPGDPVVAGSTVLARIAPSDPGLLDERTRAQAEARVRAAEAAVSRAQPELARYLAELEHVREEYERYLAASKSGAASVQDVEDERTLLRTTENAAESARFALEMSRYELEQARAALLQRTSSADLGGQGLLAFEVRSPVTGKVLRLIHESSRAVAPGDPLIEVGSLSELEVEVDVLSDQAVRVRPGQRVILERWGGQRPLSGLVRVVEPSGFTKVSALGVEEQRVNVIIDFLEPPEAHPALGDSFRVEARIIVLEKPDIVRVPVGALVRHRGGWAVYTVDGGKALLRTVTIGERSGQFAEVLSGLVTGDRVIVFPSDRVMDGVRVSQRGP